jgi:hypothetical protein
MHRRYNRWWSRFEQPDPYDGSYELTNPQSFNRYAYTNNDPVNYVDPLGLDPVEGGVLGIVTVRDTGFNGVDGGGEVTVALAPLGRPILEPPDPQDPRKPKPGTTIDEILKSPLTPEEQEKMRKAKVYSECFHNAMKAANEDLERLMYKQLRNTIISSLGGKGIFGGKLIGKFISPMSAVLLGAHYGLQNWAHELNEFDRKTYSPARKAADEKCRKEAGY